MKKTVHLKTIYYLFALVAIALTFNACSKKSEVSGTAYIQFTNADESASPMDFYVDNTKENTSALAYNQSTDYFSVTSVDHPAVIKTSASGVNVTSFNISPQPGAYYSVFYFNGFTVAYQDDVTAPQSGKARVRFINLNVGLTSDVDFGIAGGVKLVNGLTSKLNSNYIDVNPGTTFSLYTAGSTTELLNIPTSIQAGHIYTIYLSGAVQASLKATVLLQK
ncbi:DUF4397 domain-containing protein [Mucilaginibacter sp. UR6-11]|uniref:DUF4397 domain-containing protein n=1 Tax=Mucilaginibacter sp. UR6-11 TaxID=1435644 RepID=UPI001E57CF2B|nr:DUF4397 domain-containing protein [Mucilaginibacter sp. UR6-11]MCC8427064.1 DUF4397 domain-containing protein [Mucilaginibacter sp. UR6-11]